MPFTDCIRCGHSFYASSYSSSRTCDRCIQTPTTSTDITRYVVKTKPADDYYHSNQIIRYSPERNLSHHNDHNSCFSLDRYHDPNGYKSYDDHQQITYRHGQNRNNDMVTGFSRRDAHYIVDSVFSQPRSGEVSAREVTFERGRWTVREEYSYER